MKSKKATEEDFKIFKDEVNRLLEKFHICEWHVYFSFEKCEEANATTSCHMISRGVTFFFSKSITLYTPEEIKNCALHEVCHLLLGEMDGLMNSRFVTADEINRTSEATARKIQNLLQEV